jgi:hypothetical protein
VWLSEAVADGEPRDVLDDARTFPPGIRGTPSTEGGIGRLHPADQQRVADTGRGEAEHRGAEVVDRFNIGHVPRLARAGARTRAWSAGDVVGLAGRAARVITSRAGAACPPTGG